MYVSGSTLPEITVNFNVPLYNLARMMVEMVTGLKNKALGEVMKVRVGEELERSDSKRNATRLPHLLIILPFVAFRSSLRSSPPCSGP